MGRRGRRGNNEGSIYQVPGRGWMGNVSLGNGKRKAVGGKTRAEVAEKVAELVRNQRRDIVTAPARLTVAAFLNSWLRDTVEAKGSPNTYEYYEYPVRVHLVPAIGRIRLGELQAAHIREMLNERREQFSRRTIQIIHATLKVALSQAVSDGLLEKNVAKLVKTNDAKLVQEEQLNFTVLNAEQSARLLTTIEQHPWRSFITVAMMLGIRRGEVCALRWQDVDFEGGWIRIRSSIVRVRVSRLKEQPATRFSGAGSRLAPLKTPQSKRDLQMSPLVRDALVARMEEQRAERKLAGTMWREQDFIFTSQHGDHWHPCTATSTFAELRLLADLPPATRLHDLRHSYASAQLTKNIHPKLVQAQLGHARYQITMDKYSHLIPGVKSEAADAMEEFIAEGRKLHKARLAGDVPTQIQ